MDDTDKLNHTYIMDAILGGQCDEYIDDLREALKDRAKIVARRTTASLKRGDVVEFSDLIRPKYLAGMSATVVKVNRESVVVSCPDEPEYGRFQNSREVRCPNSLIAGLA